MAVVSFPYTLHPLGDRALTLAFEPRLDPAFHARILRLAAAFDASRPPGILDIVPTYHEIGIHFDPERLQSHVEGSLSNFFSRWIEASVNEFDTVANDKPRLIEIPVCYDPALAPDLLPAAESLKITVDQLIKRHTAATYHVYMIGFLPGFPYMGELPEALFLPRKSTPVPILAGSVAIAGRQTGIYPLDSPGGWHVIGRTTMQMFMPDQDPPVLLRPGDEVRFHSIPRDVFDRS